VSQLEGGLKPLNPVWAGQTAPPGGWKRSRKKAQGGEWVSAPGLIVPNAL
jgi:hypothetical protein